MRRNELDEEAIFNVAREIKSPDERRAYLRKCCEHDPTLLERITVLLKAYLEDGDFLESPASVLEDTEVAQAIPESPGSIIGPYKLIEQIGVGGMGLVYRAEQQWPVRRIVALKIIKPGMDTRQVVARFEAERQALAMMDHPNIARMLDAGTTDSGRPYFVMELVRGIMVTRHCSEAGLSTHERLRLFIAVCEGVKHAHQNGIIHRDIKPHNVLVTLQDGKAVPKVIDFGVAKAITPLHLEWTQQSLLMHMVGTPIYMSPEQAQFGRTDVDTRSDIYSLGAMLYEMLTGVPPFEKQRLQDAGYEEMLRIIREDEPKRPSVRVAELHTAPANTTAGQGTQHVKFQQALRDDLDWIVMKTLEKDRERRYESVSALVSDIRLYLADKPVEARRPSAWYRLRKFARRRKSVFALLSLGFLSGLVALSALLVSFVLVSRERTEVLKQRDIAFAHEKNVVAREGTIREYLYAADMRLGYLSWQNGDMEFAKQKLNSHVPESGSPDLRGFEWHQLQQLVGDPCTTLREHTKNVFDVRFSTAGDLLMTCSGDSTMGMWRVADRQLLHRQADFGSDANEVSFSADGEVYVTAEEAQRVRIWDARTRKELARLTGFDLPVARAFLTADKQTVVATETDWKTTTNFRVSLWDRSTRSRTKVLDGHLLLAYQPKLNQIATRSADGRLGIRSLPDWTPQFEAQELQPQLGCAEFSHDGRLLAAGTRDGLVQLWSTETKSFRQLPSVDANAAVVRDLAFSPDDKYLVTVRSDGITRIWEVASLSLRKVFWGSTREYWSADVSPDGHTLALGCGAGPVELHDISQLSAGFKRLYSWPVEAHGYPSHNLAMDRAGQRLAVINRDYLGVSIIDSASGMLLQSVPVNTSGRCLAVLFSPDGSELWFGDMNGDFHRLVLQTGQLLGKIKAQSASMGPLLTSPSGRLIATQGPLQGAEGPRVWDSRSSQLRWELPIDACRMPLREHRVCGFASESILLSCQGPYMLRWDLTTNREVLPQLMLGKEVRCLAMTSDGKYLFAGSDDGTIGAWEVATGVQQEILLGHRDRVLQLAVSPSGRTLASGGSGGEVRLWHLPTLQPLCELKGLPGGCRFLAFSPDGRRVIASGDAPGSRTEIISWESASAPSMQTISEK